ncbi:transmembrane protein 130 [Pelodytes ibericus]
MALGLTLRTHLLLLLVVLINLAAGNSHLTESIEDHITATQAIGSSTSMRRGLAFATNSQLHLSFTIPDPSNFSKLALSSYTWSFDVLRNLTVTGSSWTRTGQNNSISLNFLGSPPLSVCWLIKPDCVSLDGSEGHLVVLNNTTYSIRHIFNNSGHYCLSVTAQDGVSMLQTYHGISVYSTAGESDDYGKSGRGGEPLEGPWIFAIPLWRVEGLRKSADSYLRTTALYFSWR